MQLSTSVGYPEAVPRSDRRHELSGKIAGIEAREGAG